MMPVDANPFKRFGLSGNPFRDLSSENLGLIEIVHIDLDVDDEIDQVVEEVTEKENKAVVLILGNLGIGKTERLMKVANTAKREGRFYVFTTFNPSESKYIIKGLIDATIASIPLKWHEKYVSPPGWLTKLKKASSKILKKGYDPEEVATLIAKALNRYAPSYLLLNDLQHLPKTKELHDFLVLLYLIINKIEPGVMIMISSNKSYFDDLLKEHEALNQRINRAFVIPSLTSEEAEHIISKRLLVKRLTDDLGLLYPFTSEAIKIMNDDCLGNPRALLRLADQVMEDAAKAKVIQIDQDFIIEYMKNKKGKQLLPPAPKRVLDAMKAQTALKRIPAPVKPVPSVPPARSPFAIPIPQTAMVGDVPLPPQPAALLPPNETTKEATADAAVVGSVPPSPPSVPENVVTPEAAVIRGDEERTASDQSMSDKNLMFIKELEQVEGMINQVLVK
jgi:DNA replication protein DnaC